jgi:hypothetical protein
MNNELEWMKKEAIMVSFQVLHQNLRRGTEKSHEQPQSK